MKVLLIIYFGGDFSINPLHCISNMNTGKCCDTDLPKPRELIIDIWSCCVGWLH